ncbi:MAG: phage protein Gp37 [Nitrospirota bacterium]
MTYTIEQVQNALLSALKVSDLKGLCGEMDHYNGSIDDLVQKIEQMPVVKPSAFVLYLGSEFSGEGSNPYLDGQFFGVALVVKDLRGGSDLKQSMNSLLEICKTALIDKTLGLEISPLVPVRIRPVRVTKLFSIYSFDVKTIFEM